MTVKELIAELEKCNPEAVVKVLAVTEHIWEATVDWEELNEDGIDAWQDSVELGFK